ncbi:MAG: GntR family transcriptional regulator [Proteobacteria bacterium]|nr:MAG: GntR family transcriptional regulator [Pseudomonadota bacterium]
MLLNLSDLSNEPLYSQILRQIRALILTDALPKAEPIPSIRDLAKTYKVSVITVQKAYDELVREGLVVARRGKGYFVAELAHSDKSDMSRTHTKENLRKPVQTALVDGVSAAVIRELIEELIIENKI